jgi:hypothetical protein
VSHLITDLFNEVDNVRDGGDEKRLEEIISVWLGRISAEAVRDALRRWLESHADVGRLTAGARETSTHYVWPIHLNSRGYGIALNEFKDPLDIATGYATILHNHRYSFISVILSGGYTQVRCQVEMLSPTQATHVRELGEDGVTEGDIVTINHEEFHRLAGIRSGTVTLVVKCPAIKGESLSVETSTLRVTRHVPVEARIKNLMAALVQAYEQQG